MEEYIGVIKLFAGTYAPEDYLFCEGQMLKIADYEALYSILGTTYGGDGRTTFQLPDLRSRVPIGAGQSPGNSEYFLGEQGGEEAVALTENTMPKHTHDIKGKLSATAASYWSEANITANASSQATGTVPINAKGTLNGTSAPGNDNNPSGNSMAVASPPTLKPYRNGPPETPMVADGVSISGSIDASQITINTEVYPELLNLEITTNVEINGGYENSDSGGGLPHNNMQPYLPLHYIICFDGVYPPRP